MPVRCKPVKPEPELPDIVTTIRFAKESHHTIALALLSHNNYTCKTNVGGKVQLMPGDIVLWHTRSGAYRTCVVISSNGGGGEKGNSECPSVKVRDLVTFKKHHPRTNRLTLVARQV